MTVNLLQQEQYLMPGVKIAFSNRLGGVSSVPYASLNLGDHVGDDLTQVRHNRALVETAIARPVVWLQQVHKADIHRAVQVDQMPPTADGSYCKNRELALGIMVADCLPILLCSRDGSEIAAVHCGWRSLAANILAAALSEFQQQEWVAWLGPCIGACCYEVDEPVKRAFQLADGFVPSQVGHYQFDLRAQAKAQLKGLGVEEIREVSHCTACDPNLYSHRRDGQTGRFAAFIWFAD